MSSTQDTHMSAPATQKGPPYPPHNASLGGTPVVIPDVPVAAVFLVLYLVFGVVHIRIFLKNKARSHKFVFNGATFALCMIRVITMSLRMAWVYSPRNVGLGIAANVFVYVGTVILYMIDWFFVQRIIRAQHTKIGWSTVYRIFHRAALAGLVVTLIMLIIASVCQFFTLDSDKLRTFHALILTGQTYFTAFCVAPAVLVILSLIVPRHDVEKFGAGRLRIKIGILLVAVTLLSLGQIFRCVLAWIPPSPLRDHHGQAIDPPWYLHKTCFYVFNFVTEILVIIMFALARVDLRFHVPNGSKTTGDYYSERKSQYPESGSESEKAVAQPLKTITTQRNGSSETLHQYKNSISDDTGILADSLRFESSNLEIDEKTGTCKIKRASAGSTKSATSLHSSGTSSLPDRSTLLNSNVPPIPEDSTQWPLPESKPSHSNPSSRTGTPNWLFDIEKSQPDDEVEDTTTTLQRNSKSHRRQSSTPSSPQNSYTPVEMHRSTLPDLDDRSQSSSPIKRTTSWQNSALYVPPRRIDAEASSSGTSTPAMFEMPKLPQSEVPAVPTAHTSHTARRSSESLEIIPLGKGQSPAPRRVWDVSLQGEEARAVTPSENGKDQPPVSEPITQAISSRHSDATTGSDAREYVTAQDESRRFSFEGAPNSTVRETPPEQAAK